MSGNGLSAVDLAGRKALVVGAYGGMGRAVGIALAYEGVLCALMGRNPEKLAETTQSCNDAGSSAISIVCDVAQPATIEAAVRQAIDQLGALDFLINCAGVYEETRGDDGDLQTWDKVLNVNLKATYYLARYALPEINKSSAGAIVKVGSIAPSYSGAGAYVTTSRGLDGFGDALFEDVREHGTKVCTIRPGFVNTPMAVSDRLDPSRMIQPEDIARTVLFVLSMPSTVCPTEITLRPQRTPYL